VQITWVDNATNEDGFRVERSRDTGATWEILATLGQNVVWVQDSPVSFEEEVCYRVFAFNGRGDSPPSNTDCTAFPKTRPIFVRPPPAPRSSWHGPTTLPSRTATKYRAGTGSWRGTPWRSCQRTARVTAMLT
jgi:hypothetical protein